MKSLGRKGRRRGRCWGGIGGRLDGKTGWEYRVFGMWSFVIDGSAGGGGLDGMG